MPSMPDTDRVDKWWQPPKHRRAEIMRFVAERLFNLELVPSPPDMLSMVDMGGGNFRLQIDGVPHYLTEEDLMTLRQIVIKLGIPDAEESMRAAMQIMGIRPDTSLYSEIEEAE